MKTDKATADIDTAISCACRQIELLEEYRIRLIADIDVREAAVELGVKVWFSQKGSPHLNPNSR